MNKKVIMVIISILAVVLLAAGVGVTVFFLHGKNEDVPVETTEVYVPESSTEESDIKYAVPEVKPTDVYENTSSNRNQYSDTTVCATFAEDVRSLCDSAFGEYLNALQDSCKFLFDSDYEYFVAYNTDTDTYVVESNYLEFTAYLPGARARFNITREGDKYSTKAWFLADDEMVSPSLVAPDGPDAETSTEESVGLLPANLEGWSESEEPAVYEGYGAISMGIQSASFYTFDSDFITEMVSREVVDMAREMFHTDASLYDMISFILSESGEPALMNITAEKESDMSMKCYWENYMFRIWSKGGKVYSDTYNEW